MLKVYMRIPQVMLAVNRKNKVREVHGVREVHEVRKNGVRGVHGVRKRGSSGPRGSQKRFEWATGFAKEVRVVTGSREVRVVDGIKRGSSG